MMINDKYSFMIHFYDIYVISVLILLHETMFFSFDSVTWDDMFSSSHASTVRSSFLFFSAYSKCKQNSKDYQILEEYLYFLFNIFIYYPQNLGLFPKSFVLVYQLGPSSRCLARREITTLIVWEKRSRIC